MLSRLKAGRFASHVCTWRRVLGYALIALMACAPVARAACDIEHLATLAQTGERLPHGAADAFPAADQPTEKDMCCADGDVISAPASPASLGAVVAPLSADFHVFAKAPFQFVLRATRPGALLQRHGTQPPEPMFRRIPKLLI